ncbi:MAG: phenylalanine--tRNA ligase subunit beta [Chloroflexi bacterium]|nr:phenylalanine--tRNA ligase subunit beta [Chloroflexota bacterium]
MRVPLSWLVDYVDIPSDVAAMAHRLTLAGLPIAAIESTGGQFERIEVGRIAALEKHPNADRLLLATVDLGEGAMTVVTGAPNLQIGDHVPFAHVGAELWDYHANPPIRRALREGRIRGVTSRGMVCSAAELGLGDDHEGILILDARHPVGVPLARVFGDTVLELEVTPNRADCLSLLGIAQEVFSLYGGDLRQPRIDVVPPGESDALSIEIASLDLCSRYCGLIVDRVRVGPSPVWMQDRLAAAGIRPISNLVDVTNYVMLEFGQPLHAFDLDRVGGGRVIVRNARPGETLETLDGVVRRLQTEMLVIADSERPIGLAGVMGGRDSEITAGTTRVLLESANFQPTSIRRTARHLKLPSEASRRFERGIAPEIAWLALHRAAELIRDLGAGEPRYPAIDCYPRPVDRPPVRVPIAEFERLLGIPIATQEVTEVLQRLACVTVVEQGVIVVMPPQRRLDIAIAADVVEEVARIVGFDRLPERLPAGSLPPVDQANAPAFEDSLRDALVAEGAAEIVSYSMVGEAARDRVPVEPLGEPLGDQFAERLLPAQQPLALVNPLSSEMALLRTDLVGQMLIAIRDNGRWFDRDVALFEIGRIYLACGEDLPEERRVAALGLGGHQSGESLDARRATDFLDIKGCVEGTLDRIGVRGAVFAPMRHSLFRPGFAAAVLTGDPRDARAVLLGGMGEVDVAVRRAHGIDGPVFLALLDVARCQSGAAPLVRVEAPSRFPVVRQDLSVNVRRAVSVEDARRVIARAVRPIGREIALVDVYPGIDAGTADLSLTFRITYGADDRTLTDAEVGRAHRAAEDAVRARLNGRVRGRDD